MIFEAEPEQIKQLDNQMLVRLMRRLIFAECRRVGVPLRAATVPLQITVADGGEDGRVEWQGGSDETDYFPARVSVFQAKAQNLTEALVTAEVLKKRRGKKAALNAAVTYVLRKRGAYVVFCSYACTGAKIRKLRRAIEDAIKRGGLNPSKAVAIEIYDANRIAGWVNTHPAVALWLTAQSRKRALAGFQPHEGWGRAPEITSPRWIDDRKPRFSPANEVISDSERQDESRNSWTFEQAAVAIRRHLSDDRIAIRVAGPSGFGKSRFVYEVFNGRATDADEVDASTLIYADLMIAGSEVPRLAQEIADSGSPAILVVDECSDDMHTKLVGLARRSGSCLRLVTLDIETKILEALDTLTIRLEAAEDDHIGEIAQAVSPQLTDTELRSVEQLARGFPQMAVLAARWNGDRRRTLLSVDEMLGRVVWGRKSPNDDAQKALELASLFDWIGLTERVGNHAAYIAVELAGIPADRFIEDLKSFKPRGIIARRGDYVQVGPVPLAARLAARRLSLLADGKLLAFFADAPELLKKGLLRRLRWLDVAPEAQSFASALLSPRCIGNLDALNTDFGAECLDRVLHVDPDLAMRTIDRVFGGLSVSELDAVIGGRRHLIWALEKLAFRNESFTRAAALLRRLAASETENHVSNNATGQFIQLYQLHLSGTEADLPARLTVLDDGLASCDQAERLVCVKALGKMLGTGSFTRSGGADEIGSGPTLKDWRPKTFSEQQQFFREGIRRLADVAIATGDPLSGTAKKLLGSQLRGLIDQLPLPEIKATIDRLTTKYGFWPEAVQEINEWLYFDRRESAIELGNDVRALFDSLLPVDPVELVLLYTKGWQTDFHDPDVDFDREDRTPGRHDYAIVRSVELAITISADQALSTHAVSRLACSDARTVYPFARKFAELVADPVSLFEEALVVAQASTEPANLQFFGAIIAAADERNPEAARACVRKALQSDKLKADAISMISAGRLRPRDLDLVTSLLRSGDVEPRQCARLSYGRGMDHLASEAIMPLLEELNACGNEGLWSSLNIISMIHHGGRVADARFLAAIRDVLVAPALFENTPQGVIDGHHLHEMVKLLLRQGAVDKKFARALVAQLLSICAERAHNDAFPDLVRSVQSGLEALVSGYPDVVWTEIATLLVSADWLVQHRLQRLLDGDRNDYLGAKLLTSLPQRVYLDWVQRDPSARAQLVVTLLPIAVADDHGALSWHADLESFVAQHGGEPGVLDGIASRLRSASHLRPLVLLLEAWRTHRLAGVRKWVGEQICAIEAELRESERREEEAVIHFS